MTDPQGPPTGDHRPSWAAGLAIGAAWIGLVAALIGWIVAGGGSVELPWAASLDLRLHFEMDGLGAMYTLLATGIGAAVFTFSRRYLPIKLAAQGRPRSDELSFYGFLVLFGVSMVGLATAQDMVLIFVFWDLTAIASYYLIGYDSHEGESRRAALMALLVTGITAVLLLIGVLILHSQYGTFQLPDVIAASEPGTMLTVAAALIAVAGLAKSAQVPFHFWLPRAMVAPTPVSAYLHSAAMVAAGVLLIGRFYPLIEQSGLLLDGLLVIGLASIFTGGVIALTRDTLKQLLAYSTISQYGYVVAMFGLGGRAGVLGASFYVLSHALSKSALFLTAGAVTAATGEDRLSRLGGLRGRMPWLAAGSALAAAGLAALPLTIGFFKDELFFEAALARGTAFALLAVAGAGLTFAYIARLWLGVFTGPRRAEPRPVPASLIVPVCVLGALVLAGGIVVGPVERLAASAAEVGVLETVETGVAYHLDARVENLMALAVYVLGIGLLATRAVWAPIAAAFARLGELAGPERGYVEALRGLNGFSDAIHDLEVRDLRTRIAAVLVPCGVLVAIGLLATPITRTFQLGVVRLDDLSLLLTLIVVAMAALALTVPRDHVTIVLLFSTVGFSLAVVYAFFGGPDVALVAVLIETIFALLFFGVFSLMPAAVLRREAALKTSRRRRIRDPLVGIIAGAFAFLVVWAALSRPIRGELVAEQHLSQAPDAHAGDVVTAILADFRGLDTLGEITVVGIAMIGLATLLRRGIMR